MEVAVAVAAVVIAIWQLHLQRKEIRLNGQINSLIHMANMLKDKIDYYEKIIRDIKRKGGDWTSLAGRVNNDLRPLLTKVNRELVNRMTGQKGTLNDSEITQALQLDAER